MARSLLRSLPIAPTEGAVPARAVSFVQSVNVPLPLLRQRTFPGGAASVGKANGSRGILERKIVEARDVEIEIAVVIVVNEGEAEREAVGVDSGVFGDVFECAFAFVVIERDAAIEADGEIGLAVVVIIADGAAHSFAAHFEFRGFR